MAAWQGGDAGMPIFLLFASVANLVFLKYAITKLYESPQSVPSRAQLGCAAAELCWVLPCLVQCWITFAKGHDGQWYQGNSGVGCDVMGFYSVFSLFAGTGTTVVMAIVTDQTASHKELNPTVVGSSIILLFCMGLLFACLPLWGVGEYKFVQVICYYDWYNTAHATIILLWMIPALVVGCFFLTRAMLTTGRAEIGAMLVAFVGGWILWPPAAIIGLSGSTMPAHMMIAGGVLGHAQALVNPFLYGILWERVFPAEPDNTPTNQVLNENTHKQVPEV